MGKKNGKPKDPMSNAKTMSAEGMRLIRAMAFGTFNYYTEGHVFRDPTFTNTVITEVDKRLFDAQVHLNAMNYAYGNCEDTKVRNLIFNDQKKVDAYIIIRKVLVSVAMTGDTGFLLNLVNELPKYKYNI